MKLYTIKTFLFDLIFPRFCLGCRKELALKQESLVCESCFGKIAVNSGVRCHVCGLRNGKGTCRRCLKKTPLKGLFAAGQYQDPILKDMIHYFKYKSAESLKKPLSELAVAYIAKELLADQLTNSVLVPIPLTLRRKINRGFNQSELLALEISKHLNLPVANFLKRKKFTAPQAEISDWQKRKENISNVFKIANLVSNCKKITLVDDVATSGATLEEAARVLKEAGVNEVYGLVIAKG